MYTNLIRFFPLVFLFAIFASGCVRDEAVSTSDTELERTLIRLSESGSLEEYILPDVSNLAGIPAGIGNPLTEEKVELGKLLFHETALGRDAINPAMVRTFSCSSCHVAEAAFTPGAAQGLADGGEGFGQAGSGRVMSGLYVEEDVDAQGARPTFNVRRVAYVTNSMWAGRFGARWSKC